MTDERSDFQYEVTGQPDFSFLTVQLPPNETLKVEASAMATEIPLDTTGEFPAEPRFRIFLPTGKVAAQGVFEYG